jgi:hypothetical protein
MFAHPNTHLPPIGNHTSIRAWHMHLLSRHKASARQTAAAVPTVGNPAFELTEHVGLDRSSVETFISQRFAESFGCHIEAFMPRLFSVRDGEGEMCGAFGLRTANRNLFLEQYLDSPIEKTIAARAGCKVERRAIVEVGHFSGSFPGAVRAMIGLLTEHLHRDGFEWVVFTGTAGLRNAFCRLGLCPIDVQAATADRLPAQERAAWGSYYDHAPRVLIGNIPEGYRAMLTQSLPGSMAVEEAA